MAKFRTLSWVLILLIFSMALYLHFDEFQPRKIDQKNPIIFGITYHTEYRFDKNTKDFLKSEIQKDLSLLHETGFDVIRSDVSYQRVPIEPSRALEFDRWFLAQVHQEGMKLMFIVKTPEQIKFYSSLIDRVDFLQVNNEPNNIAFSASIGSSKPSKIIADLDRKLLLVKNISLKTQTVVNPVDLPKFPVLVSMSWLDLYEDLNYIDNLPSIIGIDSYPGGPYQWGYPLEIAKSITSTRKKLNEITNNNRPLWIIETGSPTYNRSLESQANYVENVFKAAINSQANGVVFYEAFDSSDVDSEVTRYLPSSRNIEANFGFFYKNRLAKPVVEEFRSLFHDFQEGNNRNFFSLNYFFYIFFSTVFRLIIPSGAPMALSELAGFPNFYFAALGIIFRCILGLNISRLYREYRFFDLILAFSILVLFLLFQVIEEVYPLVWYLHFLYSMVFLLFLLGGTTQIALFASNSSFKNYQFIQFFKFLYPSLIGILATIIINSPVLSWFFISFVETVILVFCKIIYDNRKGRKNETRTTITERPLSSSARTN